MYCSHCGKENREGALFCRNCGEKLNEGFADNKYGRKKISVRNRKKIFIIGGIAIVLIAIGVLVVANLTNTKDDTNDKKEMSPYVDVNLDDYIKVADYEGLEVEGVTVTDDEVEEEINSRLEEAATTETVEEGTVEDGDTVTINYEGKIDGESFDGGSAENYELTIGSGQLIDGFEDGLIGAEVGGDPVVLDLTFPDDYYSEDVAGKDVEFTVTVTAKQESVTPELDMDFIKDQDSDAESVEEYKKEVKKELKKEKEEEAEDEQKSELWQTLVDKCEVKTDDDGNEKYPDEEVDRVCDEYIEEYESYAEQYDMEYDEFVSQYTGMETDEFEEQVKEYAKTVVKQEEILYYIVGKEDIKISRIEYYIYIAKQLTDMGYTAAEYESAMDGTFEEKEGKDNIKRSIYLEKVCDILLSRAKIVESTDDSDSDSTEESTDKSAE